MKTATIAKLETIVNDFESGYVANPSAAADINRNRHEKFLRQLLEAVKNKEVINNILGES